MATISGTIQSANLLHKSTSGAGTTTRDRMELWMLTVDFAAYTGSADTAALAGVGAAISANIRDAQPRTPLWPATAKAGADANNQAVTFTGTSVAALAVSGDDLAGELSDLHSVSTEVTSTSGTTYGVGVCVCVAVGA